MFNWPIIRHPKTVVMSGIGDPLLQAWEMAWHRNFFTAADFWTANIFYPAKDNFGFTDSLLGYLPLGFLFGNGQYAAVLRYNVAYVLAFALAFIGCYLLVRQLGGSWQAAALAGVVFAWAPWRLTHNSHLNILSTGGIVLALFALARGHGYSFRFGLRPELARPWWALTGWLVAAWQMTIGFALGIPFLYLMALVGLTIVVVNVVRRRALGVRSNVANGVGLVIFLGVTYLMVTPYLRAVDLYHFTRTLNEVQAFSPPPVGLLTASTQTWLWRGTFIDDLANVPALGAGEKLLFPGLVLIVFALVGLVVSAWSVRIRVGIGVAVVVVTVLALGTTFFGGTYTFLPVWRYLPAGTTCVRPAG